MIKMVLRMMARMEGTTGVRKDGKWHGALDGGVGGEDDHGVDNRVEFGMIRMGLG